MRPQSKAFRRYPTGTALTIGIILYGWGVTSTLADDNSAAEIVREWDFGVKEDARRDGWPDDWTRRSGQDYPKFIPIAIHQNAKSAEDLAEIEDLRRLASQCYLGWQKGKWPWQVIPERVPLAIDQFLERSVLNPYLRVRMDGGMVEVASPAIKVDVHSVYFLSALIQCDSVDYDASAKLRYLDSSGKTLFEMPTKAFSGKTGWKSASTDSLYPFRDDLNAVQVVFQVQPKSLKAYRGEFGFDAVRVYRTPRLSLSVNKPLAVYKNGEEVVARCTASGMTSDQSSIELILIDHNGQQVDSAKKLFVRTESQTPRFISKIESEARTPGKSRWEGSCEWRIPNLEPGYYEISTKLAKGKSGVFELDEQFVVLPNDTMRKPDVRFGWTMSTRSNNLLEHMETGLLIELLRLAQVGRVKLPIWYDSQDAKAAKAATDRVDKIQLVGINCVGVIATPPPSLQKLFIRLIPGETSTALEDSLLVQSFLEPVMQQMCIRISDFQVGWDHEADIVSNPRLRPAMNSIQSFARRYGQETQIVASRNPLYIATKDAAIDRWQLTSSQPPTASEIERQLRKEPDDSLREPWLNLTPINASTYSLRARVQDLVSRMIRIATITSTSTTGWIANPSDPAVGMLDVDGGPREMFLPFRSTVAALAGMRHIGSLPVPSLGVNHLITNGDQARLIVWSERLISAQLYLGENVTARDVWGRTVEVQSVDTTNGPEQRLVIDKWPIIIDGIDIRVARWRMGISIEDSRIDPLVGQTQDMKIRFANPFAEPISGQITVMAKSLLVEKRRSSFELEGNSNNSINATLQLRPDANTASAPIQLKFTMQGDRPVSFVVDQEMQIGTSDFDFETRYEIDANNRLTLTLHAINHQSIPLNFDCILHIPNRPRERMQIAGLKDRITKTIVLEDAASLIGETLSLRCAQIATNRVLNYRIEIEP
jgi:hypothetical protein